MPETLQEKIQRLRRERNDRRAANKQRRQQRDALNERIGEVDGRIRKLNNALKKLLAGGVAPMNPGGWHPEAIENQTAAPLAWVAANPKLVWHTTEGFGLPNYIGSMPHFTLDLKTGRLWQHVPIRGGAYALRNAPGGIETNRAHAIQVELIGFAGQSQDWSDEAYARIAKLARWIEKHAGVPRRCSVTFRRDATHKVRDFTNYSGHLGHQHVPENDHWDPGELQIQKII